MKQKRTKKKSISPALRAYAEERIRLKQTLNKMGTAELYQVAIGHFLKFTGDKEIRIEAISKTMVTDFSAYLQQRRLATNSINSYLSALRAIYNAALHEGLLHPEKSPFEGLRLRRSPTTKRAIPVSFIYRLAETRKKEEYPRRELTTDLCLFSFLACGMPFVDMAFLSRENIRGNELVYKRKKTGSQIRMEISDAMWRLIRKYEPDDGKRRFLFPILPDVERLTHAQYKYRLTLHNKELRLIGIEQGFPIRLTSYVTRHSWASAALENEVPVAVISQALGHSSEKTTRYYLSELDISKLTEARQKISGTIELLIKRE